MEALEVHIKGYKNNEELCPDNYDIKELKELLDIMSPLLSIERQKEDIVSLRIENGSLRAFFQAAEHIVVKTAAICVFIGTSGNLNGVDKTTAIAISTLQQKAIDNGYTYEICSSIDNSTCLTISPSTNYVLPQAIYVPVELYLYGQVVRLGGKTNATILLDIPEGDTIIIQADKTTVSKDALLYRNWAVRVSAMQDITTGEIDKQSYKLIEIVKTYTPKVDMVKLNEYIERATPAWSGVDVQKWINELRGYDE